MARYYSVKYYKNIAKVLCLGMTDAQLERWRQLERFWSICWRQ